MDADCVRCVPCRKKQQGIDRQRAVFEALFHIAERTAEQSLEMAEACISLIEAGVFAVRQTQRVRMLVNAAGGDAAPGAQERCAAFLERVRAVETKEPASGNNSLGEQSGDR